MSIKVSLKKEKVVWANEELRLRSRKYMKLALIPVCLALLFVTSSLITGISDLTVVGIFVTFPALILVGIADGIERADKVNRSS